MAIPVLSKGDLTRVGKIAEGVYGIVYEAKTDTQSFAVKRLKIDLTTNFVGCVKELDMLVRLKGHPFILDILAVSKGSPFNLGTTGSPPKGDNIYYLDDRIYLVTEKAAYDTSIMCGHTHPDYIKLVMCQSLLALEYMHGHGIIHRDIKPQNLLWFRSGSDRFVKFCDFGISKNLTNQESNTYNVFTPIYKAPEILFHLNDYGYPADIWSLGCVFYELVKNESFLEPDGWSDDKIVEWEKRKIREIFTKVPDLPSSDFMRKAQISLGYYVPKAILSKKRKTWHELLNLSANKIAEFGACYDDFKDLMEGLLKIDPDRRLTATDALKHRFFGDSNVQDYIKAVRERHPPIDFSFINPMINIINCSERKCIVPIVQHFHNNQLVCERGTSRKLYDWYQERIMYQAVDIYDRFLSYYYKNKMDEINKMDYEASAYCFMVCIYLSIKYFLTILQPCQFKKIVDEKYWSALALEKAEAFEWFLLKDVLDFKVYRPTIYETADHFGIKLTPQQNADLLSTYINCDENKSTDLFDFFTSCAGKSGVKLTTYIKTVRSSGSGDSTTGSTGNSSPISTPGSNSPKIALTPITLESPKEYIPTTGIRWEGGSALHHQNVGMQTAHGPKDMFKTGSIRT